MITVRQLSIAGQVQRCYIGRMIALKWMLGINALLLVVILVFGP